MRQLTRGYRDENSLCGGAKSASGEVIDILLQADALIRCVQHNAQSLFRTLEEYKSNLANALTEKTSIISETQRSSRSSEEKVRELEAKLCKNLFVQRNLEESTKMLEKLRASRSETKQMTVQSGKELKALHNQP